MIDSKELRIGNFIKDKYGNFITVNSVCEYGIDVSTFEGDLYCDFDSDEIFGIPLTPEILERCGFSCSFGEWYKIVNEEEKHVLEFKRKEGWCFDELQLYNEPEYLHQLQNLYFALTGEELEIKELQHA